MFLLGIALMFLGLLFMDSVNRTLAVLIFSLGIIFFAFAIDRVIGLTAIILLMILGGILAVSGANSD